MKKYILYNPLAGSENGVIRAKRLDVFFSGHETIYVDILGIEDFVAFFDGLSPEDDVIVCGGDGTLNNFVNRIGGVSFENNIYYYATGSGNDFLRDLEKPLGSEPFLINEHIKNLPEIEVDGRRRKFFNGTGYGLDGYVCAIGNRLRKTTSKKINYTALAIKSILFGYRPKTAKITVDGVEYTRERVWFATTMLGRFFGGGMKLAPHQSREDGYLSLVLLHNCGKLRILTAFPSVFKGEHIKYTKIFEILRGKEISVEYDSPCDLQIDGESVYGVTSYSARVAEKKVKELI